ncbi:MAG: hypothetical protein ACYC6L_05260 [Anaerolineae bacterium]
MSPTPAVRFSAYSPLVTAYASEEQVRALAEGGVRDAILGYDGLLADSRERFLQLMGWLNQYGVRVFIFDPAVLVDYSETCRGNFDISKASAADWYKDLPNFAGHMLVDEPGTIAYEVLGRSLEDYKRAFPDKTAWINLLPMYANQRQLAFGAWMESTAMEAPPTPYQFYLDEYVRLIDTDYIAVDIYPCHHRAGVKFTIPEYVRNIEMVADVCRSSGREFWVCIQSCSWNLPVVRIPDAVDARWQVYSMLSYGAVNLSHYVYASVKGHHGAPLDTQGQKGPLWQPYRDLALELDAFSEVYGRYRSLGAFSHGWSDAVPYLRMENPYRGPSPIRSITCSDPLLVGCFAAREGAGSAFTLVNMSDLVLEKTVNARLQIDGARVTAYPGGKAVVLQPVDGSYTFTLPCGDGVFVTVE